MLKIICTRGKAYAPRSTELDLLILADMGVRRVLENEASEASCDLLPPPSGASDPICIRTVLGVCPALTDMLPGIMTGATGRSSACIKHHLANEA